MWYLCNKSNKNKKPLVKKMKKKTLKVGQSKKQKISYTLCKLGYPAESNYFTGIFQSRLTNILSKLKDNIMYKFLFKMNWLDSWEKVNSYSLGAAVYLYNRIDIGELCKDIETYYNKYMKKYGLQDVSIYLTCHYKVWLTDKDYKDKEKITKVLDELIRNRNNDTPDVSKLIENPDILKYRDVEINKYGTFIKQITIKEVTYAMYQLSDTEQVGVLKESGKFQVFEIVNETELKQKWVDEYITSGFKRITNDVIYFYKLSPKDNPKYQYSHLEITYYCKSFEKPKLDKLAVKIGAIDFEAYLNKTNNFIIYAGAYAVEGLTYIIYAKEKKNSQEFVIGQLLSEIFKLNLKNLTFYCHGLGRFDGIFLLNFMKKNNNYEITPYWAPDSQTLLSIRIKDKLTKKVLKINDSLQLLNFSLKDLLKAFNCNIQKGLYPYKFITENTLFYNGPKPNIKFFNNITLEEYNTISDPWNAELETNKYIKGDVEGLLELMLKFSQYMQNIAPVNITKHLTLPSLAMAVFTSKFITEESLTKIKKIPLIFQKYIRESYYGGHSMVTEKRIVEGEKYDMNSQYPSVMLKDMPVGNPIFSTDSNLENYFGFVLVEIIPPSVNKIIQHRENGSIVYPTTKFTRWIFSEELKASLEYGFKFKIICGINFEKGENLFDSYVNYFFNLKTSSKDPILVLIAKLFLNTLYGKFGQNLPIKETKIMKNKDLKDYELRHNFEIISSLSQFSIIVDYGLLPEVLRNELNLQENYFFNPSESESFHSSHINAVHIASAISAYARMSMIPYILDQVNPAIAVLTDSIVVKYPLAPNLIGKTIGKMKRECVIKEAIFIKPKLYYILTNENEEIIKSSGIHNSLLNYKHFVDLINGKEVMIKMKKFILDHNNQKVNHNTQNIILKK
jgi:hypothetical protein